jgi:SAM-dependent methyltransferase
VIGIDFTPQMIGPAKESVASAGLQDCDIELRRVEDMAETKLPGGSADVVISNCVINLCPGKDAVYREAFRVLRPGGRVAISDVVLSGDLATDLRARLQSTWSGCLGGAIPEEEYLDTVRQAGFAEMQVVAHHPFSPDELQAMARCPGEAFTPAPSTDDLAAVQGKVTSIKFIAHKPLASAGVVAATSTQSAPDAADGRVDEDLFRLGERVALSPEVFKPFVDALVEAERRAASAEARLTTLEAEADELRRFARLEREDLRRQLEISERAPAAEEPGTEAEGEVTGEEPAEAPAAEEPEVPAAEVDQAEPAGEPSGEAEISVGRLSESVTATITISLPPAGSVRVQWDFAQNSRGERRRPRPAEEPAAPKTAAPTGKSTVAKTAKKAKKKLAKAAKETVAKAKKK